MSRKIGGPVNDGGGLIDFAVARVPASASEADRLRRVARDDVARLKLAAIALDQPDPQEWLSDMLGALGLAERVSV